jgi:DMSO/TMAO reductase YedYZ molybdopterin-dependent catalytic subunit
MAGRRTNLALLVALVVAMGTGVAAFAVGTAAGRAVVVAHGMAGFAVVLLAPWKQQIVRRGLRRRRRAHRAGLALLALIVLTVAAGIAHAAGVTPRGGVTAMQLHVGAALLAVVPAVSHVVTRRVRPRPADLGRRAAVRAGALTLGAGVAWRAAEGAYLLGDVARRRFTGSHERGSDEPERMPVTQWLFDAVPDLAPGVWSVTIDLPASARRHLSLRDLRALPATRWRAVLDCTGGWYAAQTWSGVALSALIPTDVGRRVVVTSHTGYARAFPLEAVGDLLLALDVAGAPLSDGHGAPARLVAPGRRGFWWVKWVTRLSVDDVPPWVQPPFPVQ